MIRDGVHLVLGCGVQRVERTNRGKVIHFTCDGQQSVAVDDILVGAGRAPNVDGLNLEAAGVNYDRWGVPGERQPSNLESVYLWRG